MADDDQSGAAGGELALEPFDGREVEMVGGLVEQQDVGRGREHARQRRAPRLAAGEVSGVFAAGEAELLQQMLRHIGIVAGAEPAFHISQRRRHAGEVRLLGKVTDGRAGLHEARAAIGIDQAGGDLEQRRLAGAVAADKADAVARRDGQLRAIKQRRSAEGQSDVFELDEGRGHSEVIFSPAPGRGAPGGSPGPARRGRRNGPSARRSAGPRSPRQPSAGRSSGCGPRGSCRSTAR